MSDFDPIQYCADGMDITSSPYREQDATEIRAWTETGDLIASVELQGDEWIITDDGARNGETIGAGLYEPRDAAVQYVNFSVTSWARTRASHPSYVGDSGDITNESARCTDCGCA